MSEKLPVAGLVYEEDKNVSNPFDTRAFYELCQQYRHAPHHKPADVVDAFEAVKDFGKRYISDFVPAWRVAMSDPPPSADNYLVGNCNSREVGQARYKPRTGQWVFPNAHMAFTVSHWMPLPEAPNAA